MEIIPIDFNTFCNKIILETGHKNIMYLSIFIDSEDDKLKQIYKEAVTNHNDKIMNDVNFYDAGFDLYLPKKMLFLKKDLLLNEIIHKIDFNVKCCAKIYSFENFRDFFYYSPFYTYARSSLSKTPLRLANNQGIIDAGYRGNLIGMFDCIYSDNNSDDKTQDYYMDAYSRILQICAPGLIPIYVDIVNSFEDLGPSTSRGEGGFGSTGR
jgi:dUTP pyrophosphatase